MPLITFDEVSLEFGDQLILNNVSLTLDSGERVCLIGRNGEGKSPLMNIITGRVEADSGEIIKQSHLRVSQLEQGLPQERDISVKDYVAEGLDHLQVLLSDYEKLSAVSIEKNPTTLREIEDLQQQIEADQIEPVIAALPTQQKLVLASVLINERNGLKNIQTGQLYDVYDQACSYLNIPSLTQRRISGIIANLDMLGLITARTISRGRYGRSKEINSCIPQNVETQQILMNADENMSTVFNNRYRQQRPL